MRLKNKLFLGLLALFFAGCSEHDWVDTVSDKPVKVTAQIAKGRVGFSEMDSITYAYWENDDAITLSTPLQGNLDYEASMSAEGTGLVTFSPKGAYLKAIDGEQVFACYPASAIEDGVVSLPATDVWTDDNPLPFAYAVSSIRNSEVSLDFKHVFSFLKLNVAPEMLSDTTKAIRYVTVSTDSDVPLSTIEGSVFNFSSVGSISSGKSSIEVNTNTRVVNSNWTVYIPVLPQPAGAQITIMLADSLRSSLCTLIKQTPETGFLAGNVYRLGNPYETSYLIDGPTFNASIKGLASDVVAGRGTYDADSLIAKVKFLTEVQTLPEKYITVSAADSPAPIYASFNATDSLLTVFTPAKDIEVVDASYMFFALTSLRTIDFGKFDVNETTTNVYSMFQHCSSLNSLNVSKWNTSNVTSMSGMFAYCSALTELDVSNWKTANVTSMSGMFADCSALTELNVEKWETGNVINMTSLFYNCSGLTYLDVSGWDTSKVIYMSNWGSYGVFCNCSGLTYLDVSGWDTSNVTDMRQMFANCSALTELKVEKWETGNVTNMYRLFSGCSALTALNVSNWDVEKVTNMKYLFQGCSFTSLNVSEWIISSATSLEGVFWGCSQLTTLDLSKWDTSNVTDMAGIFKNCSSLTDLDLSSWNTEKVSYNTDMLYMFEGCSSLATLNLSNWKTSNVTTMYYMFSDCSTLRKLDISNWSINEETNLACMFNNCASASQACEITATQETQEYLLSKTGITGMNPAWFIWTNGKIEGGSSVENMPNQGW